MVLLAKVLGEQVERPAGDEPAGVLGGDADHDPVTWPCQCTMPRGIVGGGSATTLAWVGDPAAEPYARGVLARLERPSVGPARPRRAASARLDLALALLAADQPDEAAHTALEAVTSGRLVPSNYWRAAEVITAVQAHGVSEAAELNEAFRELCAPEGGAAP